MNKRIHCKNLSSLPPTVLKNMFWLRILHRYTLCQRHVSSLLRILGYDDETRRKNSLYFFSSVCTGAERMKHSAAVWRVLAGEGRIDKFEEGSR